MNPLVQSTTQFLFTQNAQKEAFDNCKMGPPSVANYFIMTKPSDKYAIWSLAVRIRI